MDKINCLGDICPLPLLKAIKSFDRLLPGDSIMIVTEHSCAVESLKEYFDLRNYLISVDEVLNGVWEVTISKKR